MSFMKKIKMRLNKRNLIFYYFLNPMFHSSWHDVEDNDLVYIGYIEREVFSQDLIFFCKREDYEAHDNKDSRLDGWRDRMLLKVIKKEIPVI